MVADAVFASLVAVIVTVVVAMFVTVVVAVVIVGMVVIVGVVAADELPKADAPDGGHDQQADAAEHPDHGGETPEQFAKRIGRIPLSDRRQVDVEGEVFSVDSILQALGRAKKRGVRSS